MKKTSKSELHLGIAKGPSIFDTRLKIFLALIFCFTIFLSGLSSANAKEAVQTNSEEDQIPPSIYYYHQYLIYLHLLSQLEDDEISYIRQEFDGNIDEFFRKLAYQAEHYDEDPLQQETWPEILHKEDGWTTINYQDGESLALPTVVYDEISEELAEYPLHFEIIYDAEKVSIDYGHTKSTYLLDPDRSKIIRKTETLVYYDQDGNPDYFSKIYYLGESRSDYIEIITADPETDLGQIKITRGAMQPLFYNGQLNYDESRGWYQIRDSNEELLARVDAQGNIYTDYRNNIPTTIHYSQDSYIGYQALTSLGPGIRVYGKTSEDGTIQVYYGNYRPFAYIPEGRLEDAVYVERDEYGNLNQYYRIYEEDQKDFIDEDDPYFDKINSMVRKTNTAAAYYAAVRGARGGIALSNLLNSWLDIGFINDWRRKADEFFSTTVLGRILSGRWEESICHHHIEKIPDHIAVVNVDRLMEFAAHIEGERSAIIETHNETLYFYKITFGVNPSRFGQFQFEVLVDGMPADLTGDGAGDRITLRPEDQAYKGTGEKMIVRYKDTIYSTACIKFYNISSLPVQVRNQLSEGMLCNDIVEVDLSQHEISTQHKAPQPSPGHGTGW